MIGSSGRKVGKTTLASRVVAHFSKSKPIWAVKATAIDKTDGQCPRGGEGCGVCSSLQEPYLVTEEMDNALDKDTSRLLQAGAQRVFWLRCMRQHLEQGTQALLRHVGSDVPVVFESNSFREVIQPGVFLQLGGPEFEKWKKSAVRYRPQADRIVYSDGQGFDFDLDEICLGPHGWSMPIRAGAIVLSGGQSSRMGRDKSLLQIDGQPMIAFIASRLSGLFERLLISVDRLDRYPFLPADSLVADRNSDQGPAMGIASALEASDCELNFVVACDIPTIDLALVRRLLDQAKDVDVVMPTDEYNRPEPLFAIYKKSVKDVLFQALQTGKRSIIEAVQGLRIRTVPLSASDRLVNLNTPDEYRFYTEANR